MNNILFDAVLHDAESILKEYSLCDNCTGRLFAKKLRLTSHKSLGKKIKNKLKHKSQQKCHICNDLISNLHFQTSTMLEISSEYQFSSFLVGIILKPSIVDKDDTIRSKFKLRGIDSVKTDIIRELERKFVRKSKSHVDHFNPDVTFTVNFKNNSCSIRSKNVILYGRYTKNSRNLSQRQGSCDNCAGKGCTVCNHHGIAGFDSVEGKIAELLYSKFHAKQIKFSWIGGEDKTSLVSGDGRPFFAKILNPKKRKPRFSKEIILDHICVKSLKIVPEIPKASPNFQSKIKLLISTDAKLSTSLQQLKTLNNSLLVIHENKHRTHKRQIYNLRYRKINSNSFSMIITVEGGVPIKRFIEGDNVHPNVSELINSQCVCKQFDFLDIILQ